eukprot:gene22625-30900_t
MSSSRLTESLRLRDDIVARSKARSSRTTVIINDEDHIFMHILDCIGALSCIRADQKKKNEEAHTNMEGSASALLTSKYSVFWQAVREIADREAASENIAPETIKTSFHKEEMPLHLAARDSNSIAMVRELAQLYPAALEMKNIDGNTPLHLPVGYSDSVEIVRELASLSPAALVTMNAAGRTPLAMVTTYDISEVHGKLQVLLEAAPQAAGIACSSDNNNLPLHQILERTMTPEMMAMVFAAYKDAVNIPDDKGWLPIHIAAQCAPVDILKLIAEEKMSNLSVILPSDGSAAHIAVYGRRLNNLRYIHAMMPELLLSVDDSNRTPLHDLIQEDDFDVSLRHLSSPLSDASDVLRFLLRHCPSLASAKDSDDNTLFISLESKVDLGRPAHILTAVVVV